MEWVLVNENVFTWGNLGLVLLSFIPPTTTFNTHVYTITCMCEKCAPLCPYYTESLLLLPKTYHTDLLFVCFFVLHMCVNCPYHLQGQRMTASSTSEEMSTGFTCRVIANLGIAVVLIIVGEYGLHHGDLGAVWWTMVLTMHFRGP